MRAANRQRSVLCFLVVTAVGILGDRVEACSCGGTPVCQVTDSSLAVLGRPDAVFVGVVTESKYPVTRFRVERMLVGEPAAELSLGPLAGLAAKANPTMSTSCDVGFTLNERYLVYASRHNETGDLVTSQCSRTRRLSDPHAAADLAYFDAREAGRPTNGWLSGVVEERHYDSSRGPDRRVRGSISRPLAGIRVTAISPAGESRSTVTNERGLYVFAGLAPVAWRVKADLPVPFEPHDGMVSMRYNAPARDVIWFKGASCAEADIDARVNGSIAGQILDDQGRSGRGIVLELANTEALRTDPDARADQEVVSDEQGRFEFRLIPAGRYVVGVALDRPRMTDSLDRRRYYPGVRQLATATVIELDRGERVQLPPFRLPSLPTERTITVVLSTPSPEVAAGTRVFLSGATKQLLTLSGGSVVLRLPFGAAYDIRVETPQGYRWEFARSVDPYRKEREQSILRDDTDRTIGITVFPR